MRRTVVVTAFLISVPVISGRLIAQQAGAVIAAAPLPSPEQIAALEQQATTHPADLELRAKLLHLYAAASRLQRSDYRIARLNHIRSLIDEDPASSLAGSPLAYVASVTGPYADPVDHSAMADLWVAQANSHFDDPRILKNAVRFLAIEDQPRAESLFLAAIAARPADAETSARLGFFYAAGLVGADSDWTSHCRTALERSANPHVLMGASIALPNLAMRRSGGGPAYEDWVRYSEELRSRASAIDNAAAGAGAVPRMPLEFGLFASDSETAERAADLQMPLLLPVPPSAPRNINGNGQAAQLILSPPPQYPPEAIQAGVEGVVRIRAVIRPDGKPDTLQLVSGPPLLVRAALEAVETWTYKPTIVNGVPIAVSITIEVPFHLPAR